MPPRTARCCRRAAPSGPRRMRCGRERNRLRRRRAPRAAVASAPRTAAARAGRESAAHPPCRSLNGTEKPGTRRTTPPDPTSTRDCTGKAAGEPRPSRTRAACWEAGRSTPRAAKFRGDIAPQGMGEAECDIRLVAVDDHRHEQPIDRIPSLVSSTAPGMPPRSCGPCSSM